MSKVTVYRFKVFSVILGEGKLSPHYATPEAIKAIEGAVQLSESIDIEASMLDGNGMYKPKEE